VDLHRLPVVRWRPGGRMRRWRDLIAEARGSVMFRGALSSRRCRKKVPKYNSRHVGHPALYEDSRPRSPELANAAPSTSRLARSCWFSQISHPAPQSFPHA